MIFNLYTLIAILKKFLMNSLKSCLDGRRTHKVFMNEIYSQVNISGCMNPFQRLKRVHKKLYVFFINQDNILESSIETF